MYRLLLAGYYERADPEKQTIFSRAAGLLRKRRSFDHLIVHSDAEGYYLPLDFPHALVAPPEFRIPGAMVGSSIRLREECRKLAAALEFPLDLDPESDEIGNAAENHGDGEGSWQRYGIESFICARLFAAAEHSIKSKAAIVFC